MGQTSAQGVNDAAEDQILGGFCDCFLNLMLDGGFGGVFLGLLEEFAPGGRFDAFVPFLLHFSPNHDDFGREAGDVFLGVSRTGTANGAEQAGDQSPGFFHGLHQLSRGDFSIAGKI